MPPKPRDHVDAIRAQWASALPDLDTTPMGVLGRIYRASRLAGREIEALFDTHGLDRAEFDALATLRRADPPGRLTPTALSASLMVSSGGMTHLLDRLERAGLIGRLPGDGDRRSRLIHLTAKGRTLVDRAVRADMALESALLGSLSAADRVDLADRLRTLLRALESREG